MTIVSNTEQQPVAIRDFSKPTHRRHILAGKVVNTEKNIKGTKISATSKKALSIAMLTLGSLSLAATMTMIVLAAAVSLACPPIVLIIIPLVLFIFGALTLMAGLTGLQEVKDIKMTDKLKVRDEKTCQLLKERQFSKIPIKFFLGYLNRQNPGAQAIHFHTNCRNLGELDTVFLGDIHSDIRVRKCNTDAVRLLCQGQDSVYVESNDASLAQFMLDTSKLPSTLKYDIWDDQRKGVDIIGISKIIGAAVQGSLITKKNNWQVPAKLKQPLETVLKAFESLCQFYKVKKFKSFVSMKHLPMNDQLKNLVQAAAELVEKVYKAQEDWIANTWRHRQDSLVSALVKDEKKPYASKALTFLDAGQLHLLQKTNIRNLDSILGNYLPFSGRKYLVIAPQGTQVKEVASTQLVSKEGVVVPSPTGGTREISDFYNLPKNLTQSSITKLLDRTIEVAKEAVA